jgi:thiol-disulfide isomerase/thioredoxin
MSGRLSTWLPWVRPVAIVLAAIYVATCGLVFAVMHQPPPVLARFMDKVPDLGWMILPMESMWRFVNRGTLKPGDPAPDFDLSTIDGQSRVKLSSLVGKPVVLFFGSYTCPPFRHRMPDMNKLYEPYKDRAHFYFIYVEEAHATDGWPEEANKKDGVLFANAQTLQDRVKAGSACGSGLKIPFPMLVDEIDNRVGRTYRAWPIRVYVVDKDGKIAFKSATGPFGFVVDEIRPALERVLGPAAPVSTPTAAAPAV